MTTGEDMSNVKKKRECSQGWKGKVIREMKKKQAHHLNVCALSMKMNLNLPKFWCHKIENLHQEKKKKIIMQQNNKCGSTKVPYIEGTHALYT